MEDEARVSSPLWERTSSNTAAGNIQHLLQGLDVAPEASPYPEGSSTQLQGIYPNHIHDFSYGNPEYRVVRYFGPLGVCFGKDVG